MTGAAALCAAVLVFVAVLLPPATRTLAPAPWRPAPFASGSFHVHTIRSDGTGTVDEAAAAAARAGLRFVIFTDHGDATRLPDAPAYRSGVLCIDAVEISTDGGHYAALGLAAAPYPLGGDPRDVVEDVARLGGFGIVTHPDSVKPELKWGGWDRRFDGIEWLNADSEWRDKGNVRLFTALLGYPFRPEQSVASLFARPSTIGRWDEAARGRRVVALAGADAHARAGWKSEGDPHRGGTRLRVPSYEASFKAFSLHVTLDRPLSGTASEDAGTLLAAIRAGHVHTLIDAFGRPGVFEFSARHGDKTVREGDAVAPGPDAVILRVRSNGPVGTRLVLFRDGREVTRVTSAELVHATNRGGEYRAEAWLPGGDERPVPWALSNPIYVGDAFVQASQPPSGGIPAHAAPVLATVTPEEEWHVEHPAGSEGTVARDGARLTLRGRLGPGGEGRSPFVALGHEGPLPAGTTALAFRAVAPGPMRVSVQVRVPNVGPGERWGRSVYLDTTPRDIVVPFADMRPAGATRTPSPRPGEVRTILFVVDKTHAKGESACAFTVSDVRTLAAPVIE